jgi:hypothetical protein
VVKTKSDNSTRMSKECANSVPWLAENGGGGNTKNCSHVRARLERKEKDSATKKHKMRKRTGIMAPPLYAKSVLAYAEPTQLRRQLLQRLGGLDSPHPLNPRRSRDPRLHESLVHQQAHDCALPDQRSCAR